MFIVPRLSRNKAVWRRIDSKVPLIADQFTLYISLLFVLKFCLIDVLYCFVQSNKFWTTTYTSQKRYFRYYSVANVG